LWQRIRISEILEDKWFKRGYKPPAFEKFEGNLDDINAAFAESDVSWKEKVSPKFKILLKIFLCNLLDPMNSNVLMFVRITM
jgi:hypothetical protein